MSIIKFVWRISIVGLVMIMMVRAPLLAREPDEAYYMAVFSAQVVSNDPGLTHSFATFVKATAAAHPPPGYQTEVVTISWMPQSLTILVLQPDPEPGTNLDLQSSLRWAQSRNCRVSMWGPYKIHKELYDRAVRQESHLKSGRVQYKTIDRHFRPGVASNCIHAVSDLDLHNGFLDSGQSSGDAASRQIVQHLDRWIIDRGPSHAWVASRLGLRVDAVSPRDPEQWSVLNSR
jgi:hypothetical protein